jgi:dihydrofolate reductase
MRQLVLHIHTTLDGFISGPNGEFDEFEPSEEEHLAANEFFNGADAAVFGRVTYEGFVGYWDTLDLADPGLRSVEREFAARFREMSRVVVSRTLTQVDAKAVLIREDVVTEIAALKNAPGRYLALVCGPELLGTLSSHGLVDEYRVLIMPTILGRGTSLFARVPDTQHPKLLSTRTFASGTVLHHYRVR